MHPYVTRVIEDELAQLANAAAGARNTTLFRVAARTYQFVAAGEVAEEELTASLQSHAAQQGLTAAETRATLRSAYRAGMRSPAVPPSQTDGPASTRLRGALPAQPLPPEEAVPPTPSWQARAEAFLATCQEALWTGSITRPLDWLHQRGFTDETIAQATLGYNPRDRWEDRSAWGLPPAAAGQSQRIWLPRGIVIPWFVSDQTHPSGEPIRTSCTIWRVSIRCPVSRTSPDDGPPPYLTLSGSSNALYGADTLRVGRPAMLVEGIFDALAVQQVAGDLVAAVASGTSGARRTRWISRLALCRPVLLAYDADAAGEHASTYWREVLGPTSRRWTPTTDDPAAMLQHGEHVRGWVLEGLTTADVARCHTDELRRIPCGEQEHCCMIDLTQWRRDRAPTPEHTTLCLLRVRRELDRLHLVAEKDTGHTHDQGGDLRTGFDRKAA